MKTVLYIGIGGAIGAILRYLLNVLLQPEKTSSFPIHTLIINTLGCLIIGFVFAFVIKNSNQHLLQYLIITGVLGSFTTFSTFSMETVYLVEQKQAFKAVLYILTSNICGITAAWLGFNFIKLAG